MLFAPKKPVEAAPANKVELTPNIGASPSR